LTEFATFADIDDALYNHESPFNHYNASGFPMILGNRDYRREWERERERLTAIWHGMEPFTAIRAARAAAAWAERLQGRNLTLERIADG
jgi:hypothetical protein